MSDDSPLGNIRQQLDQADKQKQVTEDPKVNKEPEEAQEKKEDKDGPAFPFSEAKQSPLYPHRDRWEELEDAKFDMEVLLRKHGVRDVQGRELDDAILRYAIDNTADVAELVLEARGIEVDESESGEE